TAPVPVWLPGQEHPEVGARGRRRDNAGMRALTRRVRFRRARRDYAIASLDSLMRRVEERSRASGQSLDEAVAVLVEDHRLVPYRRLLVPGQGAVRLRGPSSGRAVTDRP